MIHREISVGLGIHNNTTTHYLIYGVYKLGEQWTTIDGNHINDDSIHWRNNHPEDGEECTKWFSCPSFSYDLLTVSTPCAVKERALCQYQCS